MKKILLVSSILLAFTASVLFILWQTFPIHDSGTAPVSGSEMQLPQEHLIPNVAYKGQYLGTSLSNQESTAVRTLLSYWKDERFNDDLLLSKFEPYTEEATRNFNINSVASFFSEQGYTANVTPIDDVSQIKLLIANDVPVYIYQQLLPSENLMSSRIYIGYSDIDQEFIVHDNNFGSNFRISYADYETFSNSYQRMLSVTPLDYPLTSKPSKKSAAESDYPPRLAIMDDPGLRDIQIKLLHVNNYKQEALLQGVNRALETIGLLEQIITHEAFERLHPAARMTLSYNLTGFYMSEAPDYDRAIEILTTVTLPLIETYNFKEPFGGWERRMDPSIYDSPYWDATPWSRLGFLYLRIGDPENAREAFTKALSYDPEYPEALAGLSEID